MKLKTDEYDVGIVVGRFQVPELHDAHLDLIQTVCDNHDKVIVFLGLAPTMVTRENPLDFEARKQMILEAFPQVSCLYVEDQASDEVWSKKLDAQISRLIHPNQTVVIYGGRDSFIDHYSGKYPAAELVQDTYVSGTEARKRIKQRSTKATADFRAGVVWASQAMFPKCYATVDVAIFNEDETEILLARKEGESEYRLVGGFSDPRSPSYEVDARREVMEEVGIDITDPEYVGSFLVDDWRYRNEVDKIKTLLFKAKFRSGRVSPDDDIVEAKWFNVMRLKGTDIRPEHRELIGVATTDIVERLYAEANPQDTDNVEKS